MVVLAVGTVWLALHPLRQQEAAFLHQLEAWPQSWLSEVSRVVAVLDRRTERAHCCLVTELLDPGVADLPT